MPALVPARGSFGSANVQRLHPCKLCPFFMHRTSIANFRPPQSTLDFSCVCDNGLTPNASEYSQTVPFYECTEAATQCVNRCPKTDSACQSQCRTANPCGAQNPTRVNTTTSSTMAATATRGGAAGTDASDSSYTGFGDAATTGTSEESTNSAQALAIGFGRSWGLAVVFIGISAGFTFML